MKAEYINPFYVAVQDVFSLMFDLEVKKNGLEIAGSLKSTKYLSVFLGVTGDLKGSILFSFPHNMGLKLVEIMAGMKIEKVDNFVSSALGEVANIIGGNALTNLANNNFICNITTPRVLVGEHQTISPMEEESLIINLETDIGDFDINILLEKN